MYMSLQGIKMNELPEIFEVFDEDTLLINQNNEAKVIRNSNFKLGYKGDKGDKGESGDTIKVGSSFDSAIETKLFFKLI